MFRGTNSGPPSEARWTPEGGFGGPPPEIFKKPVLQMVQSELFLDYFFYYLSIQLGYIVIQLA